MAVLDDCLTCDRRGATVVKPEQIREAKAELRRPGYDTMIPTPGDEQMRRVTSKPEAAQGLVDDEWYQRFQKADDETERLKAALRQRQRDEEQRASKARQHEESNYYPRGVSFFADVARSQWFELLSLGIVGLNALWIWIDIDYNEAMTLLEAERPFIAIEFSFLVFFTLELSFRFLAFQRKRECCNDRWFMFDCALVALMYVESVLITGFIYITGASMKGSGNFSILRLLRLLRLTRMARLMRAIPEMMILIRGMIAAARSVGVTMLLLFFVIYIWALIFVQLAEGSDLGREKFPTVPEGMYTLLIEGIFPEQGPLLIELGKADVLYGLLGFAFTIAATLTIINMLIGILCEVSWRTARVEQEKINFEFVQTTLQKVVQGDEGIDENHDGLISKEEFLQIIKNKAALKALKQVGVDVEALIAAADFIFEEVDEDGEMLELRLTFEEFIEAVIEHRETKYATVRDITGLRRFISSLKDKSAPFRAAGTRSSPGASRSASRGASKSATPAEPGAEVARPAGWAAREVELMSELRDLTLRCAQLEGFVETVMTGQLQLQGLLDPGSLSKQRERHFREMYPPYAPGYDSEMSPAANPAA